MASYKYGTLKITKRIYLYLYFLFYYTSCYVILLAFCITDLDFTLEMLKRKNSINVKLNNIIWNFLKKFFIHNTGFWKSNLKKYIVTAHSDKIL